MGCVNTPWYPHNPRTCETDEYTPVYELISSFLKTTILTDHNDRSNSSWSNSHCYNGTGGCTRSSCGRYNNHGNSAWSSSHCHDDMCGSPCSSLVQQEPHRFHSNPMRHPLHLLKWFSEPAAGMCWSREFWLIRQNYADPSSFPFL